MRTVLLALLASVALVAPACADTSEPAAEVGPVAVRFQQVLDFSQGLYIEGSYSYVRVERPDGAVILKNGLGTSENAQSRSVSQTSSCASPPADTTSSASSAPVMAAAIFSTRRLIAATA
jgi:hypothetical protein